MTTRGVALLGTLGAGQVVGWGGTYFMPSVLGAAQERALGLPAGAAFPGITLMLVLSGLPTPRVGRWMERHGTRGAMTLGFLGMAAGLALMAGASGWGGLLLAWVILGAAATAPAGAPSLGGAGLAHAASLLVGLAAVAAMRRAVRLGGMVGDATLAPARAAWKPAAMRALPLLLLLAGCAPGTGCPAGTGPATVAELAFGRNAGGIERVGDADWAAFLAEEVTPRFPDGLTVLDAAGQWRGRDGRMMEERSKLLWLVLPRVGMEGAAAAVAPVAAAYRARFAQEGVVRVFRAGCAGF